MYVVSTWLAAQGCDPVAWSLRRRMPRTRNAPQHDSQRNYGQGSQMYGCVDPRGIWRWIRFLRDPGAASSTRSPAPGATDERCAFFVRSAVALHGKATLRSRRQVVAALPCAACRAIVERAHTGSGVRRSARGLTTEAVISFGVRVSAPDHLVIRRFHHGAHARQTCPEIGQCPIVGPA